MALKNLGIERIAHVDFVVQDLDRSRTFYEKRMDFALRAKSNEAWEAETGERLLEFEADRVRMRMTSPLDEGSDAARFLRAHPDGVRRISFKVADLDHAWKTLEGRGACLLEEPEGKEGHRSFGIASPLGDVEYHFVESDQVDPRLTAVVSKPRNRHQFTHVDHITSNTREMKGLTNWYHDVLGFEPFWDIRFHTKDSRPDFAGGSGLASIVMWDPSCGIKFATNEPLRPNYWASQIAKYVSDNRGAGVQHIALSTKAIMDVIPAMRQTGLKFLETPDAYYEMLPKRMAERAVENLKEEIEDLRKRRILVDGRDNRYLLQIFMQEASLLYDDAAAGPFFYEVIQRHGDPGFGEGNFRALFESIERQQEGETQRTKSNPYLMD